MLLTTLLLSLFTLTTAHTPSSPLLPREIDCTTIFDFITDFSCNTNNFEGLNGIAPSQILDQVIQDSDLPNSTFFANDEHVTCLFKDAKFVLDDIEVIPDINIAGTICIYPSSIPQGGLTLGEIRNLTRQLSNKCSKCGAIDASHANSTTIPDDAEGEGGFLRIDWRDPPTCWEDSNCITAKKINETTERKNAASASASLTGTAPAATSSSAGGRIAVGDWKELKMVLGSLVWLGAGLLVGVMVI